MIVTLQIIAICLIIAGIYLLAGLGWALIAAGVLGFAFFELLDGVALSLRGESIEEPTDEI